MSRSTAKSHVVDEAAVDDVDAESDPYYYGWRYAYETSPGGAEKLVQVPLTYRDLLDPQEGDFIAESTVHQRVIDDVVDVLLRRYRSEPAIAVWSNLKIAFVIPGLTTGPGPDVCVVEGVEDRDRLRKSFRFGKEPGKIRLVIEVVSERSHKKDTRDLLKIYARLGVEEYVAILPRGSYAAGPFELKGWRLGRATGRLRALRPDPEGCLHLRGTRLLLGTGEDGWGLLMRDAVTGEALMTSAEVAESAMAARDLAEAAWAQAEAARLEAEAEVERLQARIRDLERG